MSDFDTVLERLLTDPGFTAALAADPDRALAGYRLTADERELLRSQVSTGTGGDRGVEQRTSKSSLFGLFAPLAGPGGGSGHWQSGFTAKDPGDGAASWGDHAGLEPAQSGSAPGEPAHGGRAGFGAADGGVPSEFAGADQTRAGFGPAEGGRAGFGVADGGLSEFAGADQGRAGFGPADRSGTSMAGFGPAEDARAGFLTAQPVEQSPPPEGYRTKVDVDGDGRWDAHTYRFHEDGSVDVVADMDRDGRSDFVGRDLDRDGRIDEAYYDKNSDGRFETHWVDKDGDGWLDVRTVRPE